MTIEALIEKMSAVEEGSRELFFDMFDALGMSHSERRSTGFHLASNSYLDAAIALVQQHGYKLHAWEGKRWFIQRVSEDGQSALQFGGAAHNNIAIALCLALLRALQAMEA